MKFRAAVLRELNKFPEIEDLTLSDPLQEGQVLVKIQASGLCGAQLQELSGLKNNAKYLPHLIGHEGFGTIVESKVKELSPDENVVIHWRINRKHPEGKFTKYNDINCGPCTTLAEYSVVSANRLTIVPKQTDPYIGAMLGCSLTTAMGVVYNELGLILNKASDILLLGGGGLSLTIAMLIKEYNKNINIDIMDKVQTNLKEKLAKSVGAEFIFKRTKKYQIIIDTTGSVSLIYDASRESLDLSNGTFILLSKPYADLSFDPEILFGPSGITIKSSQGGRCEPDKDIPTFLSNVKANPRNIITNIFNLEQINSAFHTLKSGDCGRVMINT